VITLLVARQTLRLSAQGVQAQIEAAAEPVAKAYLALRAAVIVARAFSRA
jgi:hypothetical protein